MSLKKLPFVGSAVAIVTPFQANGSLDFEAFGRLIDFQIDNGTDAIVVLGTTGESSTLTDSERRSVIEFAAKKINKRLPFIVGTGTNRTAYSVELTKFASECGCDGVLVVTPYYNKANDSGLVRHFSLIADAAHCPVILYNIPGRTGINIPLNVYGELAKHPNIVAVKEASGNISYAGDIISLYGDSLAIYSGNDDQTLPIMAMGGKGVISVAANIVPRVMSELAYAMLSGKTNDARMIQREYHDLFVALFCEVNPIPVKTACYLMGLCSDTFRLPLAELSERNKNKLTDTLKKYELI